MVLDHYRAIKWLDDSSKLLVAAEVVPHSNCYDFGTFRAYEIELPSANILHQYGQIEAKKLFWNDLGVELRNANDDCFRKPHSCWIPMLHKRK